jgi:1-acyl-sn-glycerol-3-phosphate acyltransferase
MEFNNVRKLYKLCHDIVASFVRNVLKAEIIGEEHLNNWNGGIIASNHISLTDPPFIGSLIPQEIYFLAKKELFDIPLFGMLIRKLNAIPIRRGAIDRKAISIVQTTLQKEGSFVIFPEGSRKNFTAKPGIGKVAIKTQCPILPVYIENSQNFGSLFNKSKKLKIIFGKPISPDEYKDHQDQKSDYRNLAVKILERINKLSDEN